MISAFGVEHSEISKAMFGAKKAQVASQLKAVGSAKPSSFSLKSSVNGRTYKVGQNGKFTTPSTVSTDAQHIIDRTSPKATALRGAKQQAWKKFQNK